MIQLSKRMETGFVVAIAALTVLTTATVIHNGNKSQPDAVSRWLEQRMLRLRDWGNHTMVTVPDARPSRASTSVLAPTVLPPPELAPTVSAHHNGVAANRMDTGATNQANQQQSNSTSVPPGWTTADFKQLQIILASVASQLTPDDWAKVGVALASPQTEAATKQITTILNQYVTASDQTWLTDHFLGSAAFTSEDVVLLHQTLTELEADLTPGEQTLLNQELGQFGVTGNFLNSDTVAALVSHRPSKPTP